jgi:ribonuclease-3
MSFDNLKAFQRKIGYMFKDETLLDLALTHRSYRSNNNERLEFLGDAVLSLFIAEALFQKFPEAKEGQLSRLRSTLVKGVTLAEIGKEFKLGDYLNLGAGELKSGGHRRESIISDALEAVIGAIYLDSNDDTCRNVVLAWYQSRLETLTLENNEKDPKTKLQEYLQSIKHDLPNYDVYEVQGEAHDQIFFVTCQIEAMNILTKNKGPSRRIAEQKAAKEALKKLGVK